MQIPSATLDRIITGSNGNSGSDSGEPEDEQEKSIYY